MTTLTQTNRLIKASRMRCKLVMLQTKVACQKNERVTVRVFAESMQSLYALGREANRPNTDQECAGRFDNRAATDAEIDAYNESCNLEMPPAPAPVSFDDDILRLTPPDGANTDDQAAMLLSAIAWVETQQLILSHRLRTTVSVTYIRECAKVVIGWYAKRGVQIDLDRWRPNLVNSPSELRALNSRPDV